MSCNSDAALWFTYVLLKQPICLLDCSSWFCFFPFIFLLSSYFSFPLLHSLLSVSLQECCASYLIKFWQKFNHTHHAHHLKKIISIVTEKPEIWLSRQQISDFLLLIFLPSEGSGKGHKGCLGKCNYSNIFIKDRSFPPPPTSWKTKHLELSLSVPQSLLTVQITAVEPEAVLRSSAQKPEIAGSWRHPLQGAEQQQWMEAAQGSQVGLCCNGHRCVCSRDSGTL